MVPPAPPRFSSTNCCPVMAAILLNTMRAVTSFEPPGGNTMITRTGLLGYVWACSEDATAKSSRVSAKPDERIVMSGFQRQAHPLAARDRALDGDRGLEHPPRLLRRRVDDRPVGHQVVEPKPRLVSER